MNTTACVPEEELRHQELARLKRRSNYAGGVAWLIMASQSPILLVEVIGALILSGGVSTSLTLWLDQYGTAVTAIWGMIQYIVMLGVPLGVGLYFCRKTDTTIIVNQKIPATHAIALLSVGLSMCVVGNFVASWFSDWVGAEPISLPLSDDRTPLVLLLSLVSTAVLPAIFEELVFRGVILQLLRPAGDVTALVLSSVLFGMTHGNVEQIPFATLFGLACGYFVLKTGNIYLGMVLHFLNNAVAVLYDFFFPDLSAPEAIAWNYLLFIGMALVGLIGWLFLHSRAPQAISPVYDGVSSWLTRSRRRWTCWLNPLIVTFIVFMALMAAFEAILPSLLTSLQELWPSSFAMWEEIAPGGFPYG